MQPLLGPIKAKRIIILLRRRGHATPIVTVQTSKFFSITKNSNIAQVRTRLPIEHVLKTLKNFDGYTSCMPSSPKEYSYTLGQVQLLQVEEAIMETCTYQLMSVAAHKQLLYMNQRITLNNVVATPGASLVGRATCFYPSHSIICFLIWRMEKWVPRSLLQHETMANELELDAVQVIF